MLSTRRLYFHELVFVAPRSTVQLFYDLSSASSASAETLSSLPATIPKVCSIRSGVKTLAFVFRLWPTFVAVRAVNRAET